MGDYIAMRQAIVYNTTLQSPSVGYGRLWGAMGGQPLPQRTTEHYSVGPVLQGAMGATEGNKHPLVVLRAGELFPDAGVECVGLTRMDGDVEDGARGRLIVGVDVRDAVRLEPHEPYGHGQGHEFGVVAVCGARLHRARVDACAPVVRLVPRS